jgi:hypothetical protein
MAHDDDDRPDQGLAEAHTRRDFGRDAASAELQEAEQPDLLTGSPDLLDQDVLAAAANLIAEPRRARGRPKGAANKRNMDMVAYLAALGHRDPMVTLSMIQSADTTALAKALGSDTAKGRFAVLGIQRQAASDMLPYFYAKKPQQLELPEGSALPVIQIGEVTFNDNRQGDFVMLGGGAVRPEKPNEINGSIVRETSGDASDAE